MSSYLCNAELLISLRKLHQEFILGHTEQPSYFLRRKLVKIIAEVHAEPPQAPIAKLAEMRRAPVCSR